MGPMTHDRETVPDDIGPDTGLEPAGMVFGNVGSSEFRCVLTDPSVREMDHVELDHPTDGPVLGIVDSVELLSDLDQEKALGRLAGSPGRVTYRRVGKVSVIGRRDDRGNLYRPLTPVLPSTRVYKASRELICSTLGMGSDRDGGVYLGKVLHSDVDVVLDPSVLVQRHVALIAKSGSGKSYTCGVLAEELNKLDVPVVVLDLHGEYRTLVSPNIVGEEYERMERFGVSPKGLGDRLLEYTLSAPGALPGAVPTLGLDIRHFKAEDLLEVMGLKNIGPSSSLLYVAMDRVRSVLGEDLDLFDLMTALQSENNPAKWPILNGLEHLKRLPFFNTAPTPLSSVVVPGKVTVIELKDIPLDIQQIGVAALLKKLFQARKDGLIPPFMLVVEEAHNFCPQGSTVITSQVLQTLASEGRKFGLGLAVVSQRPAKVDKNVLSQCGTQIILKVTNPNDLKAVVASVEGLNSRMADEIQNLPVSVALVVGGNISNPVLVEVRTRRTRHGGEAVDILGHLSSRYSRNDDGAV